MAVHYTGGGGGLLGALMQGAMMAVPGVSNVAPYLMGGAALLNGNPAGAAGAVGGKMVGDMIGRTMDGNAALRRRDAVNRDSLSSAVMNGIRNPRPEPMEGDPSGGLMRAHRTNMPSLPNTPDIYDDPVTGYPRRRF